MTERYELIENNLLNIQVLNFCLDMNYGDSYEVADDICVEQESSSTTDEDANANA